MDTILCNDVPYNQSDWKQIDYSAFSAYKLPSIPLQAIIGQPFGQLLFFEMQAGDFIFKYYLFDIMENVKVTILGSHSMPNLYMNILRSFIYSMNDIPPRFIETQHYCLENKPHFKWEAHLLKGTQYAFLHIHFPEHHLLSPFEKAEKLAPLIEGVSQRKVVVFPKDLIESSPRMTGEIYKIIHCPYVTPLREIYVSYVLKALLIDAITKVMRDKKTLDAYIEE